MLYKNKVKIIILTFYGKILFGGLPGRVFDVPSSCQDKNHDEIIEISQPAPSSCQIRIMNGPIRVVPCNKEYKAHRLRGGGVVLFSDVSRIAILYVTFV